MGEGMTEEELKVLTQQTVWVGVWFVVLAGLAIYLATPAQEGGPRRWHTWIGRVKGFLDSRAHYVAPAPGAAAESAARTGAADSAASAPHQNAGAAGAAGAVRGAESAISAGSLLLSAEELRAVAAMIRHKAAVPTAKKIDTIRAGWPEIGGKSGDPSSKYARASTIYDAIFAPPPAGTTPIAERVVPAGVEFASK